MKSFSTFCSDLDCKLVNFRDRWSAYNEAMKRGVFNIWEDRLERPRLRYEFGEILSNDRRIGATELRRHIEAVINNGGEAFGIRSIAKDVTANPRARKSFDKEKVLALRLTTEKGRYVAYVMGEVATASIKAGLSNRVEKYPDALDDLGDEPPGIKVPDRSIAISSGFRRNTKVRAAVLKRANGKCEYCGTCGFVLSGGGWYVEAHHIIYLSKQGEDTMKNVIALCSNHHREAHYGAEAEQLEKKFLVALNAIRKVNKT